MPITAPCVVSLTWHLRSAQGEAIDELTEPVEFFVGGEDLLPKVEEALSGHEPGDELSLHLEPEHAFGDYDSRLVFFEARSIFPEAVEVGMQFEGVPGDDEEAARIYTITDIAADKVVVDGNHPLAGERLWFKCSVAEVRAASPDELDHGHPHGETGVSHP